MLPIAIALVVGTLVSTPAPCAPPTRRAEAALAQDLRAELDVLVARHASSAATLRSAQLRADVVSLFERHLAAGDSPIEIATTWGGWTRALLATAGDPSIPALEVERALALLEVAFDLGYDPLRGFVVRASVDSAFQDGLGVNLDAALVVPAGAVDTAPILERHLGPLRRIAPRGPEPVRATLAGFVAPRLARALEAERDHVVDALLDGRLGALHAGLRETFVAGLREDARSVALYDRHAARLGVEAEPSPVLRARLARDVVSGRFAAAARALDDLARREAVPTALHDALLVAAERGVEDALGGASPDGLSAFLASLAALPDDQGRVANLRGDALRAVLTTGARSGDAVQLAATVERATALGVERVVAIETLQSATAGQPVTAVRTLDTLLAASPGDEPAALALGETLRNAAEQRDYAPLVLVGQMSPRHERRFVEAFGHVEFERMPAQPDPAAIDLYLAHEALLEPALTASQRAALEGPCAGLVLRRRLAAALAEGNLARVTLLVSRGVDSEALADVWRHVTDVLAAAPLGQADAQGAAALIKELQRLGYTRPTTLVSVVEARVARAVEQGPPVTRLELELAVGLDVVERGALLAVVQRELGRASLAVPETYARLDASRRTLGVDWREAAPLAESLAWRALVAGEDPLVEQMARTAGLEESMTRAFSRWFEEYVFTGRELHRGVRFAVRAAEQYPVLLPPMTENGRLREAVLARLGRPPADGALEELALAHGAVIGLTRAEQIAISRAALGRVTPATNDIETLLARHLKLAPGDAQRAEVLRAGFLVSVLAADWDAAIPRFAAARKANALLDGDAALVAAADAELQRREDEAVVFESMALQGAWRVELFLDGLPFDSVQRADVVPVRERGTDYLRTKLSGANGDVGTSYTTLLDRKARQLVLKFSSNIRLNPTLPQTIELKGRMRLLDRTGNSFEWTLDLGTSKKTVSMRWTKV